jgi:hypothetical protein
MIDNLFLSESAASHTKLNRLRAYPSQSPSLTKINLEKALYGKKEITWSCMGTSLRVRSVNSDIHQMSLA